jgi:large subunit ribosomal protein L25
MTILQAKKRDISKNLDSIRAEGGIPAVFYGGKKEAGSVVIDGRQFEKVYNEAGESHTISLDIDGSKVDVLIHEVQRHPVSNMPVHIDFLIVDMNKPIEVAVELTFVGESPTEKIGGTVVKVMHEVEVRGLPSAIPNGIEVNLEMLATMDAVIHLKDLVIPKGVEFVNELESVVASIGTQKEEVEETRSLEEQLAGIEVEKKGKEEVPEEESAE